MVIIVSLPFFLVMAANLARDFNNTIDQSGQIFSLLDGNLRIETVLWSSAGTFTAMHPAAAI
jgi:hypothetical protein